MHCSLSSSSPVGLGLGVCGGPLPRLLVEDVDDPAFLRHFATMGLTPQQEVGGGGRLVLCAWVRVGFDGLDGLGRLAD